MAKVYNLYRPHRFSAAFLAVSARRLGVIFSARAFPPLLPIETAAASEVSGLP
jgi:hypothetical protein